MKAETAVAGEAVTIQQLQDQQSEQAQMILNMQTTIHNLVNKQAQLEEEVEGLKRGEWMAQGPKRTATGRVGHKESEVDATQTLLSGGIRGIGTFEDAEIDRIIESRKQRKAWPLKRKYCSSFTQEVDLLKIRCHKSIKHAHKAIRIPKVESNGECGLGNKEGRLICRLCSGKTINRNTSWMCATCLVPLCVDIKNGDSETSCHARWHGCQDLVAVNATLNAALKERRESKKRARADMEAEEAQHQQQHLPVDHAAQAFKEEELEQVQVQVLNPGVDV